MANRRNAERMSTRLGNRKDNGVLMYEITDVQLSECEDYTIITYIHTETKDKKTVVTKSDEGMRIAMRKLEEVMAK